VQRFLEITGNHIMASGNRRTTGVRQSLAYVALIALVMVMAVVMPGNSQTTYGAFYSGNELFETCKRNPAVCLGYVSGSFDAIGGEWGGRTCPPKEVTNVQIRDVVMKFLTDHSEHRHFSAAALIAIALSVAFPCPP
jgi:Rap1a immunity proteins